MNEIKSQGVDCKVVKDQFIPLFSKNFLLYFKTKNNSKKLIESYNPNFIIVDGVATYATNAIKKNIPFFMYLRGNIWEERKSLLPKLSRHPHRKLSYLYQWKIFDKCLEKSTKILSVSHYLDEIIKKNLPEKKTDVLYPGLDSSKWFCQSDLKLKHPNIGIIQRAINWEKSKELLILTKILKSFPKVHFYWIGDGPHSKRILTNLEKYENFEWLGKKPHPEYVRKFLSEIDIYALFSGYDTLGISTIEAELMKKPVIISNVGGTPETIVENETGFLIKIGDYNDWIKKINLLLANQDLRKIMGQKGYDFAKQNFNLKKTANELISLCK
ncbi:MAG: glycosyltransferase [Nitrosopumilaceae archaeon]